MLHLFLLVGALALSQPGHENSSRRWLAEEFELSIWDVQRGLPQRSARSIVQTPDGVVWIGTFDGLARLSSRGVEVVRGPVPEAHTDNAFVSLLVDRAGRLWAGTANDILCLERGSWRAYGAREGCSGGVIYDLAEDESGRILASTASGLAVLQDERFVALALPPEFAPNPEHPRLERDHAGRLWVQGRRALAYLEHDAWTIVTSYPGPDRVLGLAPARAGGVWVLEEHVLVRRDTRGPLETHALPEGLEPGDVALCEDPSGNLWVGTFENGLARLSRDGLWSIAREDEGLPNALVPTLYLDREGDLWAGTAGAGAVRISEPRFRRLHDTSPLVDDNVVTALCRADDGFVYFATHSGGLHRVEGTLAHELETGSGGEVITTLAPAPGGGLWIGTATGGLWHFSNGHVRSVRAVPASFGPITALVSADDGRLWLGSEGKLARLENDALDVQELPGLHVHGLARTATDEVWAATSRGAFRSTSTGSFEPRPEIAAERGVRSVLADGAARLWFALDGRELVCLAGDRRRSFGPAQGFDLEEGRLLFVDAIGIWLAGRDRLLRFPLSPECHAPLVFDRSDGIVLGHDRASGLLDAQGRAWVGTARGLLSFVTRDLHQHERQPEVRIHSLMMDGRDLHPGAEGLVLSPEQRAFVVRLEASLAPLHTETRFQYRLAPGETWIDCGDRLPFTQLPPGSFSLAARAAFGSGPWSQPVELALELTPRLSERRSTRILGASTALALAVVLALALHRARLRRVARRAHEALLLARERLQAAETLRLVTESVPAQLVSISSDRRLLWSNERFRQAWPELAPGASLENWAGAPESERQELARWLERALQGEPAQGSLTLDGGRHLEVAFVPQRDLDGSLLGVIGLLIDTSERRALETRLQQAQRLEALGTFAGGIAHDFNNLLAVILGRTELALLDLSEPRAAKEHLDEVLLSGLRARDLVARILTFGRRGTGSGQPCDVALAAAETLRRMRGSLPRGVQLRSELAPDCWARLDEIQVQQLVSNLVSNAVLALEGRPGTIEVELARRSEGDLELSVRDDGCGMTPEVKQRVFEPFFSTRAIGAGTGLGLSVVHGIVRECGGTIEVESSPGRGTTFCLRLPALTHGAPPTEPTLTPVAPARGTPLAVP